MRGIRWPHPALPILGLVALALAPVVWLRPVAHAIRPCGADKPAGRPTATVERVSDGDTVILRLPDGRRERTRLIGIDTPEAHASAKLDRDSQRTGRDKAAIQALGREAAAFTRKLVEGKTVEVESDVEKRDRYGRRLAYLWLNNEMVNLRIIVEGYAQPLTVPPNVRYGSLFRRCGELAREEGRGLWGQR